MTDDYLQHTYLRRGEEAILDSTTYVRIAAAVDDRCVLVSIAGEEQVEMHCVAWDRLEPLDAHTRRRAAELLSSWSGRSVEVEMAGLVERQERVIAAYHGVQETIRSSDV